MITIESEENKRMLLKDVPCGKLVIVYHDYCSSLAVRCSNRVLKDDSTVYAVCLEDGKTYIFGDSQCEVLNDCTLNYKA